MTPPSIKIFRTETITVQTFPYQILREPKVKCTPLQFSFMYFKVLSA